MRPSKGRGQIWKRLSPGLGITITALARSSAAPSTSRVQVAKAMRRVARVIRTRPSTQSPSRAGARNSQSMCTVGRKALTSAMT